MNFPKSRVKEKDLKGAEKKDMILKAQWIHLHLTSQQQNGNPKPREILLLVR